MLKVLTFTVGLLKENCYVLFDEKAKECFIIDPGDAGDYIAEEIAKRGLTPKGIIATHGHFDHISAANYLKLAFKIPLYINRKDKFLVDRTRETAKHFTGLDVGPNPKIDKFLKEGRNLKLNNSTIKVIATPGHTPGSVSLYTPGIVFVGDVFFAGGEEGSTRFKYQDRDVLKASIGKILTLPGETAVYSGHGVKTIISAEKKYHKFVKSSIKRRK